MEKCTQPSGISRDEALAIGSIHNADISSILHSADKVRQSHNNNRVFTCAIMNAKSGNCSEDCAFCAQSAHHRSPSPRFELLPKDELIDEAMRLSDTGITRFAFVTSGHGLSESDIDSICEAASLIRAKTNMRLCASLGVLNRTQGAKLKQSGISRYHHNIETARSHFSAICGTHSFDDRVRTIHEMKSAGLEACAGGIIGMGESWEQRVEMAFTLKELNVESIPLNFLNPIEGTRLESRPRVEPMDALRTIAMFRLVNPDKDLPICGGRESTLGDFQSWIFLSGANGLMVGNYLTVRGRDLEADMNMIRGTGLELER